MGSPSGRQWRRHGVATVACALAALVLHVGRSTPQFSDYITAQAWAEAHALATGEPVPASPAFGPARPLACGLGYLTHHPMLWGHVGAAAELVGVEPWAPLVAFFAAAAAATVLAVGRRRPGGALVVAAVLAASLYTPAIGAWLAHPMGMSAALPAALLIVVALASRRPASWGALAGAVAGWSAIDAAGLFLGGGAGALIAAVPPRRFAAVAAATLGGYLAAVALFVGQVWCAHGWSWEAFRLDFVNAPPPATSLMARLTTLGLAERWRSAAEWVPAYAYEAAANQHGQWAPPWWWLFVAVAAVALRPSWRGGAAALACVAGLAATAIVAPGLLPPHLHYLPRYVVAVVPLAFAVAALEETTLPAAGGQGS